MLSWNGERRIPNMQYPSEGLVRSQGYWLLASADRPENARQLACPLANLL